MLTEIKNWTRGFMLTAGFLAVLSVGVLGGAVAGTLAAGSASGHGARIADDLPEIESLYSGGYVVSLPESPPRLEVRIFWAESCDRGRTRQEDRLVLGECA